MTQEVAEDIRLHVSVRKLFDANDQSEAGFPGLGRTFALGATATF
jgi:hypothetical protein